MPLPDAHLAVADRNKVLGYLLNSTHPDGASKARFFLSFGFTPERWEILAEALLQHAATGSLIKITDTVFGPRFEITGKLRTPWGELPQVCSVWQVDRGKLAPRLITAYPAPRQT
jgi:hypothetical protein